MVPVAVFRAKKVDSDAFKEAKDVGQVSLKLKFVKKMDEPIKNASSYEVVDIVQDLTYHIELAKGCYSL
ncbi:hypothetical protein SLEP1_g14378 [Rubroshorea leprosula]|uniref:Uncharacterized protein n=1 Tax=Rubroshorea leprosula TaxID=152421 RepID=A0AAV5IRR7_9ROSI|nr:hypothetical protein SLEP1_g14378 [Rubroshorea leprosula]